jgi:hypothetical protein
MVDKAVDPGSESGVTGKAESSKQKAKGEISINVRQ